MDMPTEKAGLEIPAEGAVQQAHAHSQAAAAAAADTGELQGVAKRKRASTARDRISKIPPCAAGKRSSIYRGVTRHRWTGRYEAHLWDKSTWNQTQNKKGKQVYLGAYDEEEAAARAYDLAALKYWGAGTLINFPVTDYSRDIEEMQHVSREDYLASLRRKSSGFSRGISKYRGVARHHQNGRWEARIGRVFGNKYLYLGTYGTQEDAAAAYDIASLEYRGLNGGTNFDLSCYMHWLHPRHVTGGSKVIEAASPHNGEESPSLVEEQFYNEDPAAEAWPGQSTEPYQLPSLGVSHKQSHTKVSYPTALSLLLQSTTFRQMLDKSANNTSTCSDQGIQRQAATASAQYEHSMKGSEGFSQGRHSAFADSKEYSLKSYQANASFSHESQVASLQEEGERAILKPGLSPWQIHPAHAKEFPLANPIPT